LVDDYSDPLISSGRTMLKRHVKILILVCIINQPFFFDSIYLDVFI